MTEYPDWKDWGYKDLDDREKQKLVFEAMLRLLENEGKCWYTFHALAYALFGDNLER